MAEMRKWAVLSSSFLSLFHVCSTANLILSVSRPVPDSPSGTDRYRFRAAESGSPSGREGRRSCLSRRSSRPHPATSSRFGPPPRSLADEPVAAASEASPNFRQATGEPGTRTPPTRELRGLHGSTPPRRSSPKATRPRGSLRVKPRSSSTAGAPLPHSHPNPVSLSRPTPRAGSIRANSSHRRSVSTPE